MSSRSRRRQASAQPPSSAPTSDTGSDSGYGNAANQEVCGGDGSYTVQPGDTLWGIAEGSTGDGRNWRDLHGDNPQIEDPNLIFPGEVINIPAPGPSTYTVQPGDFMYSIAVKFGITLAALEAANPQVTNPSVIFPGEVLNIPGAC